jgi:aspartate-semialdehyde dehydrogenase
LSKNAAKIAISGGTTLLGRELNELLAERSLVQQVDAAEAPVVLYAGADEPPARWSAGATVVDLTGTLDGSVVRAPAIEPERYLAPEARLIRVAHPAAVLLISFCRRLAQLGTAEQMVVNVFEPASQRGQAAIEELQQQTIGLFNFSQTPQAVFDEQAAFNLLPRFGEEAPDPLDAAEAQVEEDLRFFGELCGLAVLPSFRLIHAPVFHGYVVSAWVEFAAPPDLAAMTLLLKAAQVDLRSADEGAPANSSIAGQSAFSMDRLVADARNPKAVWFWLAADNLRIVAENALIVAASVLEQAARRVQ